METSKRKNTNNETIPKKRKILTFGEKKELCLLHQENPKLTLRELGERFGNTKKNTVSDILKNKEKWLNVELNNSNATKQKDKPPKFPELEEALIIWISKALAANKTITGEIILAKANDFAKLMKIENFTGSIGWLSNFKKRHNIKQYIKHGEAQSGPNEEELTKEREKLQELISNFDLENVFNCDETGNHFVIYI